MSTTKEIRIEVKVPSSCSMMELDTFEKLIRESGEVSTYGIRSRIESAYCLAWIVSSIGDVVAIAALKKPNASYHKSVFEKSNTKEEQSQWPAELGWIYVRPKYRKGGLATRLVDEIIAQSNTKGIYATTREDNDPILPILKRIGFVQSGGAYPSSEGDYNCLLHLKQT